MKNEEITSHCYKLIHEFLKRLHPSVWDNFEVFVYMSREAHMDLCRVQAITFEGYDIEKQNIFGYKYSVDNFRKGLYFEPFLRRKQNGI